MGWRDARQTVPVRRSVSTVASRLEVQFPTLHHWHQDCVPEDPGAEVCDGLTDERKECHDADLVRELQEHWLTHLHWLRGSVCDGDVYLDSADVCSNLRQQTKNENFRFDKRLEAVRRLDFIGLRHDTLDLLTQARGHTVKCDALDLDTDVLNQLLRRRSNPQARLAHAALFAGRADQVPLGANTTARGICPV